MTHSATLDRPTGTVKCPECQAPDVPVAETLDCAACGLAYCDTCLVECLNGSHDHHTRSVCVACCREHACDSEIDDTRDAVSRYYGWAE